MEKKLQKFGINMRQRYKIFLKNENIRRNIMKLEENTKITEIKYYIK